MQFEDDIQALRRGELDQKTLLGRLKAYLRRDDSDPVRLRRVLDDARDADQITAADYDLLTRFIADEAPERNAVSEAVSGVTGTVLAEPSVSADFDDSMTRLATSFDADTDEGPRTVDVGSRLRDRFILDEVVGVGGMGTVYRGRDMLKIEAQDRNPYVAIKILNDSFKQRPDAFIVLQREASRQQRLAHPNIATVYDFDRTGGIIFITMEYLDGVSLDHFIKHEVRPRGGLPLEEALPLIEGIGAALSYAHARNIVHADFKPGNCFITENKQVKVLDFGIARAVKDPARAGDETLFDPRSIGALTPAYASPEMLENSADADPRDDIYALACVCHELLTGRHPFHRVPADQAKAEGLKPERIRHLSRRQNEALARALAFDRERRTRTVQELLDGLRPGGGRAGSIRAAVAVGAVAVLVALAMIAPGVLERWEGDAVIAQIEAGEVEQALTRLDELSRQQYIRVLQEGRVGIQGWFQRRYEELMRPADAEVDFPAAQALLAEAAELYPDSAALREVTDAFNRRREAYLSRLAQAFEGYLAPAHLLPTPDGEDLPTLLERLAVVDPTNPLLGDSRVAGAYADSVEQALDEERYQVARQYLDTGLALTPDDATLADLRDRVEAVEQRIAREATIARLSDDVQQRAAGVRTLADAEALLPAVGELRQLAPEHPALPAAAAALAEALALELESVASASRLPDLEAYLERAAPVWNALSQPEALEPLEDRRRELVQRQGELVELARQAMRADAMQLADGRSVTDLIGEVRAIDPADPRPAMLQSELVQERRERAERHVQQGDWAAARAELAALDGLSLTAEQREAVGLDRERIDSAEQRAIAEAEEAERLARVQQQAERERLERERRERLAAEQTARIAAAATALDAALRDFDPAALDTSLRQVLDRRNALEALQADHPALAAVDARVDAALERAVQSRSAAAGLELVTAAQELLGDRPTLVALRGTLEARLAAERAAAERAALAAAEDRLRAAVRADLADDSARRVARSAFEELAERLADEPARLAPSRRLYVDAHLAAAVELVNEKRFTVAERVLANLEAGSAAEAEALAAARDALTAARSAFREERARQEALARIEALEQRFKLEVSSGQLARAERTLDEYRTLNPDGELSRGEGLRLLTSAYQRLARQRLDAGDLAGAGTLVQEGLELAPGDAALVAIGREAERLGLLADISAWFSGARDDAAESVAPLLRRYRQMSPDDYRTQEVAWAAAAAEHLATLASDREAYNRFLEQSRALLDDPGPLAALTPLEPPAPVRPARDSELALVPTPAREAPPRVPSLSERDLLGRWCASDEIELEFQQRRMVFSFGGTRADYRVRAYEVNGDTIRVNWDDRQLGPMVFEFGDFTDTRDRMVQLRGRQASAESWQTYNRGFSRCG
ncbi:MAG TPA: serine/threonine-protein kinase [Pseudomonadales bacterium]